MGERCLASVRLGEKWSSGGLDFGEQLSAIIWVLKVTGYDGTWALWNGIPHTVEPDTVGHSCIPGSLRPDTIAACLQEFQAHAVVWARGHGAV